MKTRTPAEWKRLWKRALRKTRARRARRLATQTLPGPAALARAPPKTSRKRPGHRPGERERIALRREKAIALRRQGATFRQIAAALDVSAATAHEDVTALMMAVVARAPAPTTRTRPGHGPADHKRIMVRRIEAIVLRRQGATFRQIGEALDCSLGTAHEDITAEPELMKVVYWRHALR